MSASVRRGRAVRLSATYLILSIGALAVLVPVAWMVSTALKTDQGIFASPPRWIPEKISLEAPTRVWSLYPFFRYLTNSLLVVVSSTVISVLFSCLAGYGL